MALDRTRPTDFKTLRLRSLKVGLLHSAIATGVIVGLLALFPQIARSPLLCYLLGCPVFVFYLRVLGVGCDIFFVERARQQEQALRKGRKVLGAPPQRDCFAKALFESRQAGKKILDRYLIGFELETGAPLWVSDDDLCTHAAVFAKTGVGKTLWLESLLFQQMLRGRASGCTFIDAKRDSGTLAHIIYMAHITGRIEDLIVIDPLSPIHSYNFVATTQRADVKARKVLRAGLPPIADASTAKHYDRLAADSVFRIVRALDSIGLSWSIKDVAVALSSFAIAYPYLHNVLQSVNAQEALLELSHFATTYRTAKGTLDIQKLTDNLRGIASELHSIAAGDAGDVFCSTHSDLRLTEAIMQGKIVYFMLPRLEESEGASRMLKVFREDLEVSIGEITSNQDFRLDDPHLVIVDEGASTFSPTWANLFELARKGRFALLFGAQSAAGLSDQSLGLSQAFYERVMANVNLKVAMRLGDNKTAMDLSHWLGKTTVIKKSVSRSKSKGSASSALLFDANAKRQTGRSSTESFYEEEVDSVSADELKYGLLAEKGLAWVDLGGKLTKMRALWIDFDLPKDWKGRSTVPQLEITETDPLALGKIVDRAVLESEIINQQRQTNVASTSIVSSVSTPTRIEASRSKHQETFKLLHNDQHRSSRYESSVVVPTHLQRQTMVGSESRPSFFRLSSKKSPRKR
ncbi:hypothetical protein NIES2135_65230 (plasmid) [Leptolyngbya boryana NIES-2135]|jgi:hypothetical protein|uniref:TraD/TraG TraM recognition site domain-containing protein n=1 Tax=Leptolyngbya boryana NIES-2135 TaxID=1973484 RepID=A0A1Z4JSI6_LEPBY|nr:MULTISPECIES: TraM recognition domain-containing protein [Leptolyngbya]BAY59646.1 hypothetical protein NIES2135_65230 [Leptolyngbya boryana NIES-2135]MBD2371170.1 TraM recognition domain-containing protein [Leptolyngbya sp. FACHB-161]MBD2377866.1 TraM recognition domain-containing protein [Leptolyngbya sp. FACHB-238]MBD2402304.1 TraM recognition domain-containing protein [Leptolyngbya sp. FACHB-239]MBD2409046.1 TraM recognition domain-containing protein [Leptolyngbya sp. FACHB-402]